MMKTKSIQFDKTQGDSMQLAVIDLILGVIYCVISDV
jgi:hypothetical protein